MNQVRDGAVAGIREIVDELVRLLRLPDVDVTWSSYEDAADAITELESLAGGVERGDPAALDGLRFLFAPTAPLQEISLSSGWGSRFLELADRFDRAAIVLAAPPA